VKINQIPNAIIKLTEKKISLNFSKILLPISNKLPNVMPTKMFKSRVVYFSPIEFFTDFWSLATGSWYLVTGHWLLVSGLASSKKPVARSLK